MMLSCSGNFLAYIITVTVCVQSFCYSLLIRFCYVKNSILSSTKEQNSGDQKRDNRIQNSTCKEEKL